MSTEKHEFQNTAGSVQYLFKNGKSAHFIGGLYYTDIPYEIAELNKEIEEGNPFIHFIRTVDTDGLNPLAVLRAKHFAEFTLMQAKAIDKNNNMGTTISTGKLEGIANSNTIADAAGDSTSGGSISFTGQAALASLRK